jgi:hypothetical protein
MQKGRRSDLFALLADFSLRFPAPVHMPVPQPESDPYF